MAARGAEAGTGPGRRPRPRPRQRSGLSLSSLRRWRWSPGSGGARGAGSEEPEEPEEPEPAGSHSACGRQLLQSVRVAGLKNNLSLYIYMYVCIYREILRESQTSATFLHSSVINSSLSPHSLLQLLLFSFYQPLFHPYSTFLGPHPLSCSLATSHFCHFSL